MTPDVIECLHCRRGTPKPTGGVTTLVARVASFCVFHDDQVRIHSTRWVVTTQRQPGWSDPSCLQGPPTDLEILDAPPRWNPLPGQHVYEGNVNGGDSVDVTELIRDWVTTFGLDVS